MIYSPRRWPPGAGTFFEQAIATGRPVRLEDARGDFHFDVHINPILDADGKVSMLSILAIDITDRKNAEQALKESEERFRMLFDYAPDAYFLMDLQGNFLDVNRGTKELTGYGREELIGRNYQALPLFDEQQNSMVAALFQQAVNGEMLGPVEFNLNHKDGGNVIIEAKGLPLHRKGESLLLESPGTSPPGSRRRRPWGRARRASGIFHPPSPIFPTPARPGRTAAMRLIGWRAPQSASLGTRWKRSRRDAAGNSW